MDYYLKQMADAEQENGKRLLDVVDVHYYAQDCETDDGILQAARSLYDPDYKENSWLTQWFGVRSRSSPECRSLLTSTIRVPSWH